MSQATETQKALSDALDELLLDVIRNGRTDEEGNPVKATAADMNAAITRLKNLGIDKIVEPGSAAAELAKECGLDNPDILKFPAISDEEDAATGT